MWPTCLHAVQVLVHGRDILQIVVGKNKRWISLSRKVCSNITPFLIVVRYIMMFDTVFPACSLPCVDQKAIVSPDMSKISTAMACK